MTYDMDTLDLRDAFGPMPDDIREALMSAARSVKEEEPVKRITIRTVLIAACVIIVTMAAAIAAGQFFGWNDFFSDYYGSFVPQPARKIMADSGETEFTLGPVTFSVGGLYCDGYLATSSTTVRVTDGSNILLTGDDPFDPIGANGDNGKMIAKALGVDPEMSWAEAAKQLGRSLYSVRTALEVPEELSDGGGYGDPMFNEDGSLTFFSAELMNGKASGDLIPCRIFLRAAEIDPDRDPEDQPEALREWKDISIPLAAPIDTRQYMVPEKITVENSFHLEGIQALHMPAGLYLTATFTALEGATEDMAVDILYNCEFVQPDGERFPAGMNLSTCLYTEGLWPRADLMDLVSAEEIPQTLRLKLPDGNIMTFELKPIE